MTTREPIHLGGDDAGAAREPVILLHPFLLSQGAWHAVAEQIADTGRYEVFAPTMPGHNGGPKSGTWFLSSALLADYVERQMDELGWNTAHIVGNSLGGWVAFELESRGRARTVSAIAPAGGWTRWSPLKYEAIFKFTMGMPLWALARWFGARSLRLPFGRRLATLALSARPDGVSESDLIGCVADVANCPAYFQLMGKSLLLPGLIELAQTAVPTQLVFCGKDRVFPQGRYSRHFTKHLPRDTKVTKLDGVGHVPMLEAPGRVTEVIVDFLDQYSSPLRALDSPAS